MVTVNVPPVSVTRPTQWFHWRDPKSNLLLRMSSESDGTLTDSLIN